MDAREPQPDDDGPDAPTTEYAANQEPGRGPEEGYVDGQALETETDLEPHEPPGQG